MTDLTHLDAHRSASNKLASENRRARRDEKAAAQRSLSESQTDMERRFLAARALTLPDILPKIEYLLDLYADTEGAQTDLRILLISDVLEDLRSLSGKTEEDA